ncbi:Smr/MutS family protein [Hyphomicrobium facile]|uniref:DNA-nicking endonuclease, Smr domain n=1 Tax=Hyphomicrobium facile TaxID=51670 RepID=A0A1I7NSH5_9HYPH|nr:Smr/MutS family protein [Hyphomicrobium facile]SFV37629.1 DNA-nicking endonuclease, Smr domain [Hyphomicrobium facile]
MKKQSGGGKGRGSADDSDLDHEIWRHTAATIEPLKRAKARFHPASDALKAGGKAVGASRPKVSTEPERPPAKPRSAHAHPEISRPKPSPAKAPDLALFDRNSVRKLRGGRTEIEARVDLHGMRQDEAHVALRSFLFSCQRRGLRFVLVITGKGKTNGKAPSEEGYGERERGVLKRNVPRWLDEPELRAIVVSFTVAAIQHGGEGAMYVHLRSKNRV